MDFGYTLAGFVVGTVVGLTGVGGGSLMTPLLVLLFGVPPVTAVGTDLIYAAITKSAGAAVHGLKRSVEWRLTGLLAAGSLPAAALTLAALAHFDLGSQAAAQFVSGALGVALLLTAASLLFRRRLLDLARRSAPADPRRTAAITVVTGAALGVLVSVSSVGAGALGVAALVLLYPRLPTLRIVGSDIAHAVPLALVAGSGHWLLGNVDWTLLGGLLLGSIPGITLGSLAAARIPERALSPLLASLLAAIGGKLLTQ
jgi:uncharacterized membrane protein YfcA